MSWASFEITAESHFSLSNHAWQESLLFVDPVFVVSAILLSLTIIVTLLYYERIRRASTAYEEAKSVVGDIVISFDKQLQWQQEQLTTTTQKVENVSLKNERLSKRLDEKEARLNTRLEELTSKAAGPKDYETLKNELEKLGKQLKDLADAQENFKQRATAVSDSAIETAFPIKKERALAPLTETELQVLELIAEAGEKTAPEIRNMIKLTREHTARLMKKLYEDGYLERRAEKTPYAYRVKEEMLRILKKNEANV